MYIIHFCMHGTTNKGEKYETSGEREGERERERERERGVARRQGVQRINAINTRLDNIPQNFQ